jgi:UDP-glucose 4-epimerase
MKVLVTGGAGYVGQALIDLLDNNVEVTEITVIDNLSSSSESFFIGSKPYNKVRFIKGDILNYNLLSKVVKDIEVVFHLASYTSHTFTYSQNLKFEQVNQWGTLNLVRAIQDNAKAITKFFYLSSLLVYGFNQEINIELGIPQPSKAYGISKYEAEKYVSLLDRVCEIGIIRSANIFGFNSAFRKDSVLNNFIFNAILNKKITIYGNGEQSRSFVDVNNVARKLNNLSVSKDGNSPFIQHMFDFNSTMNNVKDWLLTHVEDLEYTYLNTNIEYDSQIVRGAVDISDKFMELDKCYKSFYEGMKVRAF